jgi:RNA-directed DNA polymerase
MTTPEALLGWQQGGLAMSVLRPLRMLTVGDRVAQMVVKMHLEPLVDPQFHPDSDGYRPRKSASDAVATARERCWVSDWVIDLDINGFFDNLDHELVMKTVRHHTKTPWILLYIERWLNAPVQKQDGSREERTKGSPQGWNITRGVPVGGLLCPTIAFALA